MSYKPFNAYQWVKELDTGENLLLGGFKFYKDQELKYIAMDFYYEGALPTLETFKIEVYYDSAYSVKYCESNTINLADIENISTSKIGYVRFDFDRYPLSSKYYWFFKLVVGNYTKTPLILNTIFESNDNVTLYSTYNPPEKTMAMQFVGFQE